MRGVPCQLEILTKKDTNLSRIDARDIIPPLFLTIVSDQYEGEEENLDV